MDARSGPLPAEQDVDAQVGVHLAAQLRELLRSQSLDVCCTRLFPGVVDLLRHGTKSGLRSAVSPVSALPALLESSWSTLLTQEVLNGVRVDAVPAFLDALLLSQASSDADVETFFQQFKPKTSQGLCGYMFQRNDIAFNCRTCQLDETCVLCLKCYQNGNHEGHDIYFHRTAPGGMCDCGDAEAWDPNGFCVYHGNHDEADAIPLPESVTRVADVLFEEIVNFMVEMAKTSMDLFDPGRVDRLGRQLLEDYRVRHQLDSAVPDSPTQQAILTSMAPRFHVRICNDDVHSDEDLVGSLTKKQIPDARRLVRAIDSNGSELVATNVLLRDALALMQQLQAEGWHVCVVHDAHIHDEDVLVKVIQWVKTMCSLSKPLHKMFCAKLFATSNTLASPKEPIQIMFLSDPYFRKEIVTVLYELYLKLQSEKDPKLEFSLVFLKVYNRLMVKYFCGIGTRDESLFQYGVQIFTTPSIVTRLAGLGLLENLLDTINTALDLAKTSTPIGATRLAARSVALSPPTPPTRTLDCDHSILKFKRYAFVVDNFSYVMNIPSMSSELLLNRDLLRKWFGSLRQMQGLDPQLRIQDGHAHVTYETQLWFSAFNFHSYVSRLLTILCKGLRQHEGEKSDKAVMVQNVMTSFWEQLECVGVTEAHLAMHTPTFGFGVDTPLTEHIVKYDVATQPVSFHYPLHGFLANFLLESLYYGPEVTNWHQFIDNSLQQFLDQAEGDGGDIQDEDTRRRRKLMLVYGMMEFPLRTLVLCAQIQSGLWIRNGQSMHRQMLHYTNPPLCSELRDLDLLLIQISACVVGFSKFLNIYFDRFGLMEWLQTWTTASSTGRDSFREATFSMGEEKLVSLLEGALLQLIWMVTELPPPLSEIETRDIWLRREIVHRLSQNPCRLSELLDQTGFMASTPFGGVSSPQGNEHLARLEQILEDIADVQVKKGADDLYRTDSGADGNESGMEPTKYALKKEFYREYDPSFYHLSRSSHEKAQFARQEALFKQWKAEDEPIPLVHQLPPAHASFAAVRTLVVEKGLIGILRLILEDATSDHMVPKKTTVMVMLRTIHMVNLVTLVLKGDESAPPLLVDTKKRRVLALLRSGPAVFEESDSRSRGKKRYKRGIDSESDGDIQMSSDSDQGGEFADVQELSIVALLVTLAKDQIKHDFETSKSSIAAIYWILKELAAMDTAIHEYVQENVWKGMQKSQDHAHEQGLSKAQLRKLHQQRAIEAMLAKQKAFAQSSLFAEMEEMDEDEMDDSEFGERVDGGDGASSVNGSISGSTVVYRPPPPPDCIICTQKKKHEPVMYIGHAQTSQVNIHALQEKPFPASPLSETFPAHLFLSLCGHAVHLQCWRKYFDSVKAQSRYNLEHSQSNIAFDAHYGEFLCPLCQSLSSMLVPHVPPSRILTHEDQQRDRDAMEKVFQAKQDTSSLLLWLTEGLPGRLEAMELQDDDNEDRLMDDPDFDDDDLDADSDEEEHIGRHQDEVRAMKQFAVSFLEAMARFQPELTHISSTITSLKKSFFSTGPQLAHLIWSSVSSTCVSAQLSGISAAIFALESANSPTEKFLARKRQQPKSSPVSRQASDQSPGNTSEAPFSSLRITSLLNPPLPSLKTRLAVSLPESLEGYLDPFSPKDDSKLNSLLRSLRRLHLLFKSRKQDFYHTMCRPIQQNLRLALTSEEWMASLARGAPLQLGQPILGQDLFYLCVAICSSMLQTKSEILMTIRTMCVLHMAQVLLQIARMTAEEHDDDDDDEEAAQEIETIGEDEQMQDATSASRSSTSDRPRLTRREREMARHLSQLMDRLSVNAGVDVVALAERDGAPYVPPRGSQLLYLFTSSSLAFMRQVTLLCRGFFRGEHDPDAANYANFVSSLRLSTNFHDMCQQLGLPSIEQILNDDALMEYLDKAANQLRQSRFACVPNEAQYEYRQHGHVEGVLQALEDVLSLPETELHRDEVRMNMMVRNLNQLPPLPIRCVEEANNSRQFYFANVRLAHLAPLYTDLHSEVLAHCRCPQTGRFVENPAICMVCEQVLCAGTDCCRRSSDGMGACTAHAISCGYGVGLFFLMRSSSVLLVFGPRSSYFGSPYLDMFGEEDINLRRGRPLYLNGKRMRALLTLYANHQLANEVARNRRTSDQYIRNNYY
ncbi:hypothetical protein Poli38472_004391 [Pythium oligandrum]|uniref:E3 ubiquitin-protein ligase n=1 Tax=Pythium oligandrum TaxID=41045 RepID=A0A8K1CBF9_PYTOL|nr:hypothetical protein Poli38472_004391 [Pythium oligandrum]|eukprot:TMW59322.1 hypothetical protein Poli38472_004391 [Pythium oligandrum]